MSETRQPRALPGEIKPVPSKYGGATYVPAETPPADADASPGIATPTIRLLGLDFADLTLPRVASHLAERPPDAPFRYVVTPNADHLVRINRDLRLSTVYRNAALCVLDSRVVFGLASLFGLPAPKVVTGADLTAYLLGHHMRPNERIAIVGLSPAWLPALVARYGLVPPAHYDPPMGFENDPAAFDATVAFVRDHPARFVFLAVGSPRQEYLAAAIATRGGATGTGLCVGAALEFLAGARRRAPGFISRSGLEWLFRLLSEPRRLYKRYLITSPAVIALLLKQRLAARRPEPAPPA
jgi:N-acetylglucosaminyldiphosphoundecaprenol N-acetyl-beta-D-mannosaminyltransferase